MSSPQEAQLLARAEAWIAEAKAREARMEARRAEMYGFPGGAA